ncbi:MAG: HD domain-containing phosphohydrolase [Bacillota bacterium]
MLKQGHAQVTNEILLQSAFNAIRDEVFILDNSLTIVKTNQNAAQSIKHALPLTGKKCYEAFHNRTVPCDSCPSLMAIADKQMHVEEVVQATEEGVDLWLELVSYPLLDHAANVAGVVLFRRDITERKIAEIELKRAHETLQYQLRFEKMVAEISATFVNRFTEKLDEAVDHVLRLSGGFFNADRSYVFRFSDDGKMMNNTHEWCADGIEPQIEKNKNYPVDKLPWWARQNRSLEHVHIPDVEALPPEAAAEKQDFQSEDIKSLLTIPMSNNGQVTGFLGFDAVREKRTWTEEQISLLKVVAEIISNAFVKHQAEVALKVSEEKYRDILASMADGYYEVDLAGNIVFCNEPAARMLGYTSEEFMGLNYREFSNDPDTVFHNFNQVFLSGQPKYTFTMETVCKDGSVTYSELSMSLSRDKSDNIVGFRGVGRNVTERKRFEDQLKYLSLHDQLTGLHNRAYFENELNRLCGSREYPISIISFDMDGLKLINDTMGHSRGDELIKAFAAVVKQSLRGSDILARMGGDEFAALMLRTDEKGAAEIVERIAYQTEQYNREHAELPLSISLGVAAAESAAVPLMDVFKKADDLMFREKLYRGAGARSHIVDTLLAALAERDYITEGHAQRLSVLCRKTGEAIGLSPHRLSDLALLAQVHDLGKVGIPDGILFKPGALTEEEWEVMRLHPEKGYRIASSSQDLSGVADLILKHHERWDGTGYPLGLKGEEIPAECRILAIVDAFDAMTSERPYSRVKSIAEALAELNRCAGTQFDPELVDIFLNVFLS